MHIPIYINRIGLLLHNYNVTHSIKVDAYSPILFAYFLCKSWCCILLSSIDKLNNLTWNRMYSRLMNKYFRRTWRDFFLFSGLHRFLLGCLFYTVLPKNTGYIYIFIYLKFYGILQRPTYSEHRVLSYHVWPEWMFCNNDLKLSAAILLDGFCGCVYRPAI
jgi:hypothetical protein